MITAYLFHAGGHEDPEKLNANEAKSFQGSIVLGMGFTFDDTDTKGVANPLSLMHDLVAEDPSNKERIFPYIGGEEVNDSPTHSHHRYVINFADWPLRRENLRASWAEADERQRNDWLRNGIVPMDYEGPVAADWPARLRIIEQKVKPERDKLGGNRDAEIRKQRYWLWGRFTPALFETIAGMNQVLFIPFVAKWHAPVFIPASTVVAGPANVIAIEYSRQYAVLQSSIHEGWVQFLSSSLEERQRYTPSDCFETFPFPAGVLESSLQAVSEQAEAWTPTTALETAGREYYEFRAALMVRNNEGLTKTYNRFHDPSETSPDILKLRESHAAMDRAVLEAYGWHDLVQTATCEFLLDYEDEEDEELSVVSGPSSVAKTSRRKKPWRYRWPDEFRDEVLARLLALNKERAEQERLAGKAAEAAEGKEAGRKRLTGGRKSSKKNAAQRDLPGV